MSWHETPQNCSLADVGRELGPSGCPAPGPGGFGALQEEPPALLCARAPQPKRAAGGQGQPPGQAAGYQVPHSSDSSGKYTSWF